MTNTPTHELNTTPFAHEWGGRELLQQARDLCAAIERLPASANQTNLITRVSEVAFALQQLQMTGTHFWPRRVEKV